MNKLLLAGAFALAFAAPGAAQASLLSMNATTCYDPITTLAPLGQGIVTAEPGYYVGMWGPDDDYRSNQDAYNSPHMLQDFGSFGIQAGEEWAIGTYTFALFDRSVSSDPLEDYCFGNIYDYDGNLIEVSTVELCETEDIRYIETVAVELTGTCVE